MVKFDTVTKKYNKGIVALKDVCFEIPTGEFCFITGSSGAWEIYNSEITN